MLTFYILNISLVLLLLATFFVSFTISLGSAFLPLHNGSRQVVGSTAKVSRKPLNSSWTNSWSLGAHWWSGQGGPAASGVRPVV